jgi:hypothetical protein
MKARNAIKRLRKAHLLLSSVVKQYTKSKFTMRDLSDAVNSIERTRAFMEADETSSSTANTIDRRQKASGSTKRRTTGGLTKEGRRKLSVAAKERWAAAKRKGKTTLSR